MYQDERSDFETLLKNEKCVTIHVKNLHWPVTEIYKVKGNIFFPTHYTSHFWLKKIKTLRSEIENKSDWERVGIKQNMAYIARGTHKCFIFASF